MVSWFKWYLNQQTETYIFNAVLQSLSKHWMPAELATSLERADILALRWLLAWLKMIYFIGTFMYFCRFYFWILSLLHPKNSYIFKIITLFFNKRLILHADLPLKNFWSQELLQSFCCPCLRTIWTLYVPSMFNIASTLMLQTW